MRGSKELSNKHTRPVLAKIMRAYISEVVAVMRGAATISEIYIEGDGVWGVFNTTTNPEVVSVMNTVAQIASVIDILNVRLAAKKYSTVSVGIGVEDGSTLYIKGGYKGSGINEVVWVGRIVGKAAALCNHGNRNSYDKEIMVSDRIYNMLDDHWKSLLGWNSIRNCYHSNAVNTVMNNWVSENA